jgi:tRNA A58 N-methylase Trm61
MTHAFACTRPLRATPSGARHLASTLFLAVLLASTDVGAQVEVSPRDGWQRVDEIFAALDVQSGDRIADIGAGSGFLSFRLSRAVGPDGRVLAVDISRRSLRRLWNDARDAGLANIDTIVSERDDPKLPPWSVDGVVIVNAYHEMRQYEAMLAGIRLALRPGGRLVIVDNPPVDPQQSRARQTARHDIAMELVEQDLEANGFEVIRREPEFVNETAAGRQREQWMLVAVVGPLRR